MLSALALFSISRWLIYLFNTPLFSSLTPGGSLKLFFQGMRFDLVVLSYINLPLILFYTIPFKLKFNKVLQKTIDFFFVLFNGIAVTLNLIDVVYFRFIGKRMTSEFFQFFGDSDENVTGIAGQILSDFWYMAILVLLFVLLLFVVAKETKIHQPSKKLTSNWYVSEILVFFIVSFLTVLAMRGGVQRKPLNMMEAHRYAEPQNLPVVLNTPFTMVNGSKGHALKELHLVEETTYSPIHYGTKANRFVAQSDDTLKNVVVVILESVGQEMIGYYNNEQQNNLTPFIDSLFRHSLTFDGRSNGRRSIETLPSILSGLPSLMEVDYPTSQYSGNIIKGFGDNLRRRGYQTAFFHGGNNGTMNFDTYSNMAGFKQYFGRKEYPNGKDYDGNWGIYDGPFFKYVADKLNDFQQPFAAVVYTLSSHHPYSLPEGFPLPKESVLWTDFEKTVYYADQSLKSFFNTASKMDWFKNTLFVVTADHANTEHFCQKYSHVWGMYAVPLAFYSKEMIVPSDSKEIAQHIDLNLSILSALGLNDTVFSFGRNVFDSLQEPRFISFINQTYQYGDGEYLIQSDGKNNLGVFKVKTDSLLKDNLSDKIQCIDLDLELRNKIQEYNNRMIHNKLYVE
jgi:Phosphoglycerol transferase and related proteins, alkaline phosphatase superfamily